MCVYVLVLYCLGVRMYGFCNVWVWCFNVWVCLCMDFILCGCVYVGILQCVVVCIYGFCNVWMCVCVGFVMCGCVYVWVL